MPEYKIKFEYEVGVIFTDKKRMTVDVTASNTHDAIKKGEKIVSYRVDGASNIHVIDIKPINRAPNPPKQGKGKRVK
jgi:hypothetical protein